MEDDVKIYGQVSKEEKETELSLEIAEAHRNNGNIDKAVKMGVNLGNEDAKAYVLNFLPDSFMTEEIIFQAKALTLFTVKMTLEFSLSAPVLVTTVLNTMYDTIKENDAEFYDRLSSGVVYSFYFGDVKKQGSIAENIGNTFSRLCSKEDEPDFSIMGEKIWRTTASFVKEEIEKAGFSEI